MTSTGKQALRKRPPPVGIAELLSAVNKLPRSSDESLQHQMVSNSQLIEVTANDLRYLIFIANTRTCEFDSARMLKVLEEATQQLSPELQIFVKPERELLTDGGKAWANAIGFFLAFCAAEASGHLFYPDPASLISEQHRPYFGFREVEAMRQRYLFLFAVREIFAAIASAHVSLDGARRWLVYAQESSSPSSILGQVKVLVGWFDINENATNAKDKTHSLRFVRSEIVSVLEKIEVERIRLCPICEQLFWAGRLDQIACSPRCGNTLRARRWRQEPSSNQRNRTGKLKTSSPGKVE